MSDTPSKQEFSIESDSSSESSSEEESDPPIDNKHTDSYDKVNPVSLADNVHKLLVDSDVDDDKDDVSQSNPCHAPPQPFEFEGYSEDDSENSETEDNMPERVHNRHSFLNSPQWYTYIRRFLTERQREDLWNITAWVDKWYWDDIYDNGPPPERLLFMDSIGLF